MQIWRRRLHLKRSRSWARRYTAFADKTASKSLLWSDQIASYPLNSITLGGAVKQIQFEGEYWTSFSLSGGAPGGRSILLVLIEPKIAVAITANADGPNSEEAAQKNRTCLVPQELAI